MTTFYRTQDCPHCLAIQEVLDGLALAYTVVVVEEPYGPGVSHAGELPMLEHAGRVIRGREAVLKHLESLADVKDD